MASDSQIINLAKLRMIVGCVGEHANTPWWNTGFFSQESQAFLSPIFPRTAWLARLTAISKAASRVHDEHIGVGQVYHLFRLPEGIEQTIADALIDRAMTNDLSESLGSLESAASRLAELAVSARPIVESGPVRVGSIDGLMSDDTIYILSATYHEAFNTDSRVYPYLDGSE